MREFLTKLLDYMISMFFKLTFKQIKNFHYWLGSVAPMDPPWYFEGDGEHSIQFAG